MARFWTLRSRLLVSFGLVTCLLLGLALMLTQATLQRILLENQEDNARLRVWRNARQADLAVERVDVALLALRARVEGEPEKQDWLAYLVSGLRQVPADQVYGMYAAFEKYGPDGKPLMSWVDRQYYPYQVPLKYDFHEDRASFEWYHGAKRKKGELYVTEPYFDRGGSDISMVSLVRAFYGKDGEFRGVTGCDVSLSRLREELLHSTDPGVRTLIVSRGGLVVVDSERSVKEDPPAFADMPEGRVAVGASGSARLGDATLYWESCPLSGWRVVQSIPDALLREPLAEFMHHQFWLLPVSLALMLLVVNWVAGRVAEPVRQLHAFVAGASGGSLASRELLRMGQRQDELGSLARTFTAMVAEVDARKEGLVQAQKALEQSQRHFLCLIEGSSELLVQLGADGCIRYASPQASAVLGQKPSTLKGASLLDRLAPEQREQVTSYLQQAAGTRARDGSLLPLQVRTHPQGGYLELRVHASLGGGELMVGLLDVSEREKNLELLRQSEAAEAAARAKSTFLANMSHELRTPLNAIIGYSEMLIEEAEDLGEDDSLADLRKIHLAGKNLLQLINDILDYAKLEAGKMQVYLEPVEFEPLVEELLAGAAPLAERNGNQLTVDWGEGAPGPILSDQPKLRQCLFNLLSNACKFTQDGKVVLRVRKEGAWIRLEVEDTGPGIDPEKLPRLFEPFSQADSSITRRHGGAGLGLLLTRRLAQLLGGDVQVQSQPGQGSRFTLILPARSADGSTGTGEEGPEGVAGRILAVDDDPETLELLTRMLTRHGFEVDACSSGKEALVQARTLRPDLILLDVLMPEMDGWEVLDRLRADPELKDMPVIFLTVTEGDPERASALGVAEHLSKPVDRAQLMKALRRHASGPGVALVVEDENDVREMLVRLLNQAGWRTLGACNGREALDVLRQGERPDLILTDLMMPEMDGFALVRALREDPELSDLPVLVLTSHTLSQAEHEFLRTRTREIASKSAQSLPEFVRQLSLRVRGGLK